MSVISSLNQRISGVQNDERRKLSCKTLPHKAFMQYMKVILKVEFTIAEFIIIKIDFGHKDDGRCTLYQKYTPIPAFQYITEPALHITRTISEAASKKITFCELKIDQEYNYDKFLTAPERKNVWTGGIRSQCEGVLCAKTYKSTEEDRGVYTVIPEIDGSDVSVDAVYKMWLALECAMIRRESLIIVEDPALAHVTKFRTEQWRLLNRFVRWGCGASLFFATILRKYPSLYIFPFCLAIYGYGMLGAMNHKDPASRYSECSVNKQYEVDPDSHFVCDAQISMKYLRCSQYRMFKLEDSETRDEENTKMLLVTIAFGVIQLFRSIYSFDFVPHIMVRRGYDETLLNSVTAKPLNLFEQLRKRFFTFGNSSGPGRSDTVHWITQYGLFYYFFLRHIPWAIQTCLEYFEREYAMETTIRYLQFRNLCGEERYEFPAKNLYLTMQKDFPNNRILKELYDHYNDPPYGYYESDEFLQTRQPEKITLLEAIRRCKLSYYRNW